MLGCVCATMNNVIIPPFCYENFPSHSSPPGHYSSMSQVDAIQKTKHKLYHWLRFMAIQGFLKLRHANRNVIYKVTEDSIGFGINCT